MSILAIPIGPLAQAWKALFVANPVAGVVVAAVAIAGYGIYEETRKKQENSYVGGLVELPTQENHFSTHAINFQ